MDVHEVLVAARNILDATQWRRGASGTGPGLCVEEALGVVLGYLGWEHQNSHIRESEAYRVLHEAVGGKRTVYGWNDHVCRSKADALDAFDRAIAATAPAPPFESLSTPSPAAEAGLNQGVVSA